MFGRHVAIPPYNWHGIIALRHCAVARCCNTDEMNAHCHSTMHEFTPNHSLFLHFPPICSNFRRIVMHEKPEMLSPLQALDCAILRVTRIAPHIGTIWYFIVVGVKGNPERSKLKRNIRATGCNAVVQLTQYHCIALSAHWRFYKKKPLTNIVT